MTTQTNKFGGRPVGFVNEAADDIIKSVIDAFMSISDKRSDVKFMRGTVERVCNSILKPSFGSSESIRPLKDVYGTLDIYNEKYHVMHPKMKSIFMDILKQAYAAADIVCESATAELYAGTWNNASKQERKAMMDALAKAQPNLRYDVAVVDKLFDELSSKDADAVMDAIGMHLDESVESSWNAWPLNVRKQIIAEVAPHILNQQANIYESPYSNLPEDTALAVRSYIEQHCIYESASYNLTSFVHAIAQIAPDNYWRSKHGAVEQCAGKEFADMLLQWSEDKIAAQWQVLSPKCRKRLCEIFNVMYINEAISNPAGCSYAQAWWDNDATPAIDRMNVYNRSGAGIASNPDSILLDKMWVDLTDGQRSCITAYLREQHVLDEGLIKFLIGAVTFRWIWKKLANKYRDKVLKLLGLSQPEVTKYGNLDLDDMPSNLRGKVESILGDYAKNVNESADDKELQHVIAYLNTAFVNEAAGDKDSVIQEKSKGVWGIIGKNGEFWPQDYDSYDAALAALRAYHANAHVHEGKIGVNELRKEQIKDIVLPATGKWWDNATKAERKETLDKSGLGSWFAEKSWSEVGALNQLSIAWTAYALGKIAQLDEGKFDKSEAKKHADNIKTIAKKAGAKMEIRKSVSDPHKSYVLYKFSSYNSDAMKEWLSLGPGYGIAAGPMPGGEFHCSIDMSLFNDAGIAVDESLSADGKIAYSTIGVAFPVSSIKAICSWLAYDMTQNQSNACIRGEVLQLVSSMGFDCRSIMQPSALYPCGTPNLDLPLQQAWIPAISIKNDIAVLLTYANDSKQLIVCHDGDWFVIVDTADIARVLDAVDVASLYITQDTMPLQMPAMKRQVVPTVGMATIIQICKRFAGRIDDDARGGVFEATQTFEAEMLPSFVKNIVAAPDAAEFLKNTRKVTLAPNTQYAYAIDVNGNRLWLAIDGRWWTTSDPAVVALILANTQDIEAVKAAKKSVEQFTQQQIMQALADMSAALTNVRYAVAAGRCRDIAVIAKDVAADKDVEVQLAAGVDVPVLAFKDEVSPIVTVRFMYDGKAYEMTPTAELLHACFMFVDNIIALF